MSDKKPKLFIHGCYIGTTGFNNHTRDFFREISKSYKVKVRNFTVGKHWKGLEDEPFNKEEYLLPSDKILLDTQTYFGENHSLHNFPIYKNHTNIFNHDLNIVLAEVNHHFFYQDYEGPKIGYTVWETTRYPDYFFDKLKEYDQLWVPSEWQKQCNIEQGMSEDMIKVIPEAVDSKTFHPNPEANLPEYKDDRFKFIHFGRWDYRKSTKEIIEAFLEEFGEDEPIDLVLSIDNRFAKDGLKNTEKRLEHYGISDPRLKVKHFPSREDYVQYLQKGHVFLSCARSEGWNLPLIEAMACGTPSIYSNCSAQLQFAKGKGLPVKITGKKPAIMGEYSTYSQSDMTGEFYTPDYEDLKIVMRDAYENYDKHKKQALKESKEIRDKFTWERAAELASIEIDNLYSNIPKNRVEISFNEGPKVQTYGSRNQEYFVEFIDARDNKVIHSSTIKNNMWTVCSKQYYIPWIIKINGKIEHKFDLTEKLVKITFDSKSVGDTLAWAPQILEFQKKHKCKVIASTFHNEWFENLEEYKNITFIKPDTPIETYTQYKIGWFKKEGQWDFNEKTHTQPNTVPLIQTITDILDLPYKEINKGIDFIPGKRPIKGKYICIGPRSTAGLKEWPHSNWRGLAKRLYKKGYKVVNLSYEGFVGTNIINKQKLSWEKTFNYLHHADLFIGLGSGLSWVNWALNNKTVMINNFIPLGFEFTKKLTKIENTSVCNNCWVNKDHIFDAGDWDWCPKNKGTKDQHICHKSITVDQVYSEILNLLDD